MSIVCLTLCLTKQCREVVDRNTFLVVSVSFASGLTFHTVRTVRQPIRRRTVAEPCTASASAADP